MPDDQSWKDRLQANSRESFSATYMGLISVLQGAVLGLWVYQVHSLLVQSSNVSTRGYHWIAITVSFLTILAVWNEYRMGTVMFYWVQGIVDTLIPFFLAFAQVFAIFNVRHFNNWLVGVGGFWIFGGVAYLYMYIRSRNESINKEVLDIVGVYRWINPVFCVGLSAICGISLFGETLLPKAETILPEKAKIVGAVVFIAHIAYFIRGECYWGRFGRQALR